MSHVTVRVLLVEDDAVDRLACRRALAAQSDYVFEVADADTARAGLSHVHAEVPDLILLDYRLPDMDGHEVARALREVTQTPLLFLTARSEEEDVLSGMASGAAAYITKPFLPRALKEAALGLAGLQGRTKLPATGKP